MIQGIADVLGGAEVKAPPKQVKHVIHRHTANKGHVFEHHFTHPQSHPMEEHAFGDNDSALQHFQGNVLGMQAPATDAGAGEGPAQ